MLLENIDNNFIPDIQSIVKRGHLGRLASVHGNSINFCPGID